MLDIHHGRDVMFDRLFTFVCLLGMTMSGNKVWDCLLNSEYEFLATAGMLLFLTTSLLTMQIHGEVDDASDDA